jgi:hypothetical protein
MSVPNSYTVAMRFFESWQEGNRGAMRALLVDDAKFESPSLGVHQGGDAVLEQYSLEGRFAHLDGVALRGVCPYDEAVYIGYDLYFLEEPQRSISIVDKLTIYEGQIREIFSVSETFVRK